MFTYTHQGKSLTQPRKGADRYESAFIFTNRHQDVVHIHVHVFNGEPSAPVPPEDLQQVIDGWKEPINAGRFGEVSLTQVADVFAQLGLNCKALANFIDALQGKQVPKIDALLHRAYVMSNPAISSFSSTETVRTELGRADPLRGWEFTATHLAPREKAGYAFATNEGTNSGMAWQAQKGTMTVSLSRSQLRLLTALNQDSAVTRKALEEALVQDRPDLSPRPPSLDDELRDMEEIFAKLGVTLQRPGEDFRITTVGAEPATTVAATLLADANGQLRDFAVDERGQISETKIASRFYPETKGDR